MFWNAVVNGLAVLTHWQTYAAGALFLLLTLGPMVLVGMAMGSSRASGVIGCLSVLIMPFFQVFALCVFVTTMFPILLGFSTDAAWSLPWTIVSAMPWGVFLLLGKLLLCALALAFVPLIGKTNSAYTAVIGGVVLILTIGLVATANPNFDARHLVFWPGFWFAVGLLLVGAGMAWLGTMCAGMVGMAIEAKYSGVGQMVATPLAATFGFIPLFIYAAWLGNQLHPV